MTIAQGGAKVLLVDADLRRGKLHKLMGFKNEAGLSDLLKNSSEPAQYLQTNSHPNLTFISCGTEQADPGNLFLSPKMESLLQRWRQEFDHVIIDTCPVFAADDAATLAPKVDGTLFIVRSGYSRFNLLNEALNQLTQRQARIVGIIYNRANATGKSYHYYQYAEYGGADGAKS
jgi:capsular exopolysaccharide synthesis family protein